MKILTKKTAVLFIAILSMVVLGPCQVRSQQGKTLLKVLDINASRVVIKEIIHGVQASDHYGIYSELFVNNLNP